MALICRDLRRFACSLSLFHPGGTPLPLPPFVHPSARLSVRPPARVLPVPLLRPRHAFSVPSDKSISPDFHFYASIPRVVQSGRTAAKRLSRHAKNPRNRTIDERRARRRRWRCTVPFSLSLPSIHECLLFPFSFSTREKAITRLERSRENKGRGFNGGRSGTKRCWLVYITDRSRIRSKGDYR